MEIETINRYADSLWATYCEIFPRLVKFDRPTISLNNRLTRTAGRCFQVENRIDLGAKFFVKFHRSMFITILPHEMAHAIDYLLNGESELKCGHGKNWCIIMIKIGLEPSKYHSLDLND